MEKRAYLPIVLALVLAASACVRLAWQAGGWSPVATVKAQPAGACFFPAVPAATPQQTAWQLFVAANCPANGSQVLWETWTEQSSLYPASGAPGALSAQAAPRRLHGSPLARARAALSGRGLPALVPSSDCNTMNAPPNNVVKNATICEEVHMNPSTQSFVAGNGYRIRPGQTTAAQKGTNIQFPPPAVEVKVDWIPASDFNPPFTCAQPPQGVRVETFDGTCYAMAGMHISSKLLTNWLLATFEPQSMLTNPLRCITFGPCFDPFGSNPAGSSGGAGGFTNQTPAVTALMKQASLSPEFFNYRLDGTQVDFTTPSGAPTYLGNSVIEGENVGMTFNTASCITCHSVSSIENNGVDGITKLNNQVGPEYPIPAGWIARDFVWSMGLACPDVPGGGGLQTCSASGRAPKKGRK